MSTPNALAQLTPEDILRGIQRHQAGDWGDLCAEDRQANDQVLVAAAIALRFINRANGTTFWIITEHDRLVTMVLLPEDY